MILIQFFTRKPKMNPTSQTHENVYRVNTVMGSGSETSRSESESESW
ncbi:Uncharacterized protein APZ42_006247 [Daphnia magna]|uniref:Uncharacterized protein n=1 Tax=Daphnia magna TaxID=35525 RepID=A0A164G0E0_9CRUS|nr:Uncharacterized protein APZ42_006247 [Daphnia magna]